MARRSYLQNIAQPLVPGEPVLFPVPRAAADEARPAAVRQGPGGGGGMESPARPAPVLRRKQMGQAAAGSDVSLPIRSDVQAKPVAPGFDAAMMAGVPAQMGDGDSANSVRDHGQPDAASPPGLANTLGPKMSLPGTDESIAAVAGTGAGGGASAVSPVAPGPPNEAPERVRLAPTQDRARAAAVPGAMDFGDIGEAVDPPGIQVAGDYRTASEAGTLIAGSARSYPSSSAAPADRNAAAPVRLHIGTIEVRTTQPQAPAPAPATPAAPAYPRDAVSAQVSRGYGWRFGLSQG